VLVVADGEVRGRLRPVWGDWAVDSSPERDDWWDVRIPASHLRGVRVERTGAGSPLLVLELSEDLASALLDHPDTGAPARRWHDQVGSPDAWALGTLTTRGRREGQLQTVLHGLTAAGAPAAG
jgi:hypothetical protein